jgi:hypothetical protein
MQHDCDTPLVILKSLPANPLILLWSVLHTVCWEDQGKMRARPRSCGAARGRPRHPGFSPARDGGGDGAGPPVSPCVGAFPPIGSDAFGTPISKFWENRKLKLSLGVTKVLCPIGEESKCSPKVI